MLREIISEERITDQFRKLGLGKNSTISYKKHQETTRIQPAEILDAKTTIFKLIIYRLF